MSDVKDAMNASAAGGSAARRIAGEAGREYVLHKDPQLLQKEAAAGAAAAGASGMEWAFGFFGHGALLVWMMASEMIESGSI